MNKTKRLLFTAGIALATAFTFSCSGDGDLEGGGSSSSEGGLGEVSSSSGVVVSSSSVGGASSSSSGGGSSSSVGGVSSSSSLPPSSSSQAIVPIYGEPITDARDGKTYETVVMGKQTWMAKNLDFESEEGSTCYNNNALNCTLYGRLYNWDAAMTACPAGWHLPNDMEWTVLRDFVGGETAAAWRKLWATSYHSYGTDDYGFSATFVNSGSGGYWSSAENSASSAYYRAATDGSFYSTSKSNTSFHIRCVKGDNSPTPSSSSYTPVSCQINKGLCDDRDGKSYKSVDIDGKTWMAENLDYEAEGSRCYGEGSPAYFFDGRADYIEKTLSAAEVQANCAQYGRLYDWQTAMAFFEPACNKADCSSWLTENHKGVCPNGWHLPSREEFQGLVTSAGGGSTAGQVLKATSGWPANGADLLGFSALPSGYALSSGSYYWFNTSFTLWSSTYGSRTETYDFSISGYGNSASVSDGGKSYLRSVRCVKD